MCLLLTAKFFALQKEIGYSPSDCLYYFAQPVLIL